jgi:hypothetical protein
MVNNSFVRIFVLIQKQRCRINTTVFFFFVFFISIVDVFFMKTCNFRGSQPRLFAKKAGAIAAAAAAAANESEGILCQAEPVARYGMIPCYERNCFLCQSQRGGGGGGGGGVCGNILNGGAVQFSSNAHHRFVNKYETFLNCNAVSY